MKKNISKLCVVELCDKPYHAKGFCGYHYYRWKRIGENNDLAIHKTPIYYTECEIDDCERPAYSKGVCMKHYQRFRIYGSYDYKGGGNYKPRSVSPVIDKNTILVSEEDNGWGELIKQVRGKFVKYTDEGLFKDIEGGYWIRMHGGRFRPIDLRIKERKARVFGENETESWTRTQGIYNPKIYTYKTLKF